MSAKYTFTKILTFAAIVSALIFNSCQKELPDVPVDPDPEKPEYKPIEWDGVKRADVTYQILVYSFAASNGDGIGDFNGIASKMDYFNSMGISALWLSPIHPADSYHGYDVTDYDAVNPEYGTMADFENLVKKCHDNNIKVYIDYVMNHSGKGHEWFKKACADPTGEFGEYYLMSQNPKDDIAAGKFPMLDKSEYYSNEWCPASAQSGSGIFRCDLDWSNASSPQVTVTKADTPDASEGNSSKYLYFGDGICKSFHSDGGEKYHLTVNFESNWGFLIRTSKTTWDGGTKYGSKSNSSKIAFGKPFALDNKTAADIMFESQTLWYYQGVFSSWMPDLNYGAVASCSQSKAYKAIMASAKKWVDRGVDGFRLDAIKHVYNNTNYNPDFWNTFYTELNAYCQSSSVWKSNNTGDLFMVGEAFEEASAYAKNYKGLPSLFEFSFWWRLTDALNNQKANTFVSNILNYRKLYSTYRSNAIASTKLSNHDEDRAGSTLGKSAIKEKQAAAFLLTAEGKPFIYQGEELGYYGTKANGDEYVRTPMKWTKSGAVAAKKLDGKVDNAMLTENISVEAQQSDANSVLGTYRKFLAVRNSYPALYSGKMSEHQTYNASFPNPGISCWYMTSGSETLLVVHNVNTSAVAIEFTDSLDKMVICLGTATTKQTTAGWYLTLGGNSSVIFKVK